MKCCPAPWCSFAIASALGCAAPVAEQEPPQPAAAEAGDVEDDEASTADAAPSSDIYLGRLDTSVEPWVLGELRNVTARAGYDNQPSFDTNASFLYTSIRERQSDIYRYAIEAEAHEQLSDTPSNEYSPTPLPEGEGFSVVRELDGVQTLWRHDPRGAPVGRMFEALDAIGYHLWLDGTQHAAFFLVGESEAQHRLVHAAAPGAELAPILEGKVGRCMAKLEGGLSYVEHGAEGAQLMRYSLESDTREPIVTAREDSEDYAWVGDADLLMGEGSELWRWNLDAGWTAVKLEGELPSKKITRIAVSPDHRWVAFVEAEPSE